MKTTLRLKIMLIFYISLFLMFGTLLCYIHFKTKPDNMETVKEQSQLLIDSKASEVGMWIYRKISELRVLAETPAFKSMDIRGITPVINNLTESFKAGGDTMETFSYGGTNSYSGFSWVNADATLDLMVYEDYAAVFEEGAEYAIGSPILSSENKEVMLFYYPIQGYNEKYEGLLCSAVPTVRLKEIVNTMNIYKGKPWIMNKEGTLFTTSSSYFHQKVLSKEQMEVLLARDLSASGNIALTDTGGRASTVFYSPVPYSDGWVFCILENDDEIYKSINGIVRGLTILFLVLALITGVMGALLAKSVTNPIKDLERQMSLVKKGDMQAYYNPTTKDEIYSLGQSYNLMLDQINKLIEKIYEEQSNKRKAELQVLQEQIKPHFLYNTLDNLKWMAKDYGAEDIAQTVTSLSTLFRTFLSEGREKITLDEEFKLAGSYLTIQRTRYGDKLTFHMDLEPEIEDFMVVKIIVQPLVENAIYHGVKPKKLAGHIEVKGRRIGDFIVITVTDDGVGMSYETLEEIKGRINARTCTSNYGLYNIAERLRLTYGDKAGLDIESTLNAGTRVTIKIRMEG